MEIFRKNWTWGIGLLLLIGICWWQFGPRSDELVYKGHKFEYLEPLSALAVHFLELIRSP